MKTRIYITLFAILLSVPGFCQQGVEKTLRGYNSPDEMVTLSANLPFSQAIDLLSKISEKKTGRKIISQVKRDAAIGVEIVNVQYEKALLMIVQYAGLMYDRREDVTVIKSKTEPVTEIKAETYADIDSREVRISAIFFEMDISEVKSRGINWQFLLSNKAGNIGTSVKTTGDAASTSGTSSSADFTLSAANEFGMGGFFGQAASLFRYFESQNVGEILASPSIIVRDRNSGKIQVGSDISIKTRDFSGNIIDQFYATGSIIRVTPYIYEAQGIEYCLLDLDVERSSGFPSELSTEIKRTSAKTQILMVNGKQTVIGGLYLNEDKTVRNGIPILKDLPWWVLGIRYLTGSDEKTTTKKELVIVIKVDLIPRIKERIALPNSENPVKEEINRNQEEIKFYKFNSTEPKKD
jgi:type IV pilus assembly protein PilQ